MTTLYQNPGAPGAKVHSIALIGPDEQRRKSVARAFAVSPDYQISEYSFYPSLEDVPGLLEQHHDIVVLDLDGDSEYALKLIESICRSGAASVMTYSAKADSGMLVRCMRAGAREFLTLPLSPESVAEALTRTGGRRRVGRASAQPETNTITREVRAYQPPPPRTPTPGAPTTGALMPENRPRGVFPDRDANPKFPVPETRPRGVFSGRPPTPRTAPGSDANPYGAKVGIPAPVLRVPTADPQLPNLETRSMNFAARVAKTEASTPTPAPQAGAVPPSAVPPTPVPPTPVPPHFESRPIPEPRYSAPEPQSILTESHSDDSETQTSGLTSHFPVPESRLAGTGPRLSGHAAHPAPPATHEEQATPSETQAPETHAPESSTSVSDPRNSLPTTGYVPVTESRITPPEPRLTMPSIARGNRIPPRVIPSAASVASEAAAAPEPMPKVEATPEPVETAPYVAPEVAVVEAAPSVAFEDVSKEEVPAASELSEKVTAESLAPASTSAPATVPEEPVKAAPVVTSSPAVKAPAPAAKTSVAASSSRVTASESRIVVTATATAASGAAVAAKVRKAKKKGGKLITFIGVKGGVGTTSIACGYAESLARESGKKVLLIDLELPIGGVALTLGINTEHSTLEALSNYDRLDGSHLSKLLIKNSSGVNVLVAPEEITETTVSNEAIDKLLEVARSEFDYVVVDAGARRDWRGTIIMDEVATVCLVAQDSTVHLRNANQIISQYFDERGPKLEVILNRYAPVAMGNGALSSHMVADKHIAKTLNREVEWKIPRDSSDTLLMIEGTSVYHEIQRMTRFECGLPDLPEVKKQSRFRFFRKRSEGPIKLLG